MIYSGNSYENRWPGGTNYIFSISRVQSLWVKRYLVLVSHTKMCKHRLAISTLSHYEYPIFQGTWDILGASSSNAANPRGSTPPLPQEVYIHLRQPRYRAWASGNDADRVAITCSSSGRSNGFLATKLEAGLLEPKLMTANDVKSRWTLGEHSRHLPKKWLL